MKLTELLDRPIAYHRCFVPLVGATGAIFLSQTLYWSNRTSDTGGWFYKTQAEWEDETGLTRFEQETIRKKLRECGILEEKLSGLPAKLYFRLSEERLSSMLESSIQGCGKVANKYAGKPHTILYTETTTENTIQEKESTKQKEKQSSKLHTDQNSIKDVKGAIFSTGQPSLLTGEVPCSSKAPCRHCSKCSLVACTEDHIWAIANHLNLNPTDVREKHRQIMEMIDSGDFQKKYKKHKTVYRTLENWLRMSVDRGYIEELSGRERGVLVGDSPEARRRKQDIIKKAIAEGRL